MKVLLPLAATSDMAKNILTIDKDDQRGPFQE